ncbi:MAG: DsbA family oxidoreductase [Chloroflexia bacterium]|jgi:predicted DsbA family dithiol-disulfide isomerase|nr:DsbA family oxidoreductase [Chloroflexia bacterium]
MIHIDIFSDVVCPWCYIGERRLQAAIAQCPDLTFERSWQPFQLRPDMPNEGQDWKQLIDEKFGGAERADEMFAHITQLGKEEGIEFAFDRIASAANTTNAHRLILFAAGQEREWETANALYRTYFTDGKNLNDLDDLVAVAERAGLDPAATRNFLQTDEGAAEVQQSQATANQLGISGVPFFIFNNQYAVSGAQPAELFLEIFDTLREEEAAD